MRISDLAAKSGLSPDTIRYYERIGLMPQSVRDGGGRRSYGAQDLAWASFLQKLQAINMPMRDRLEYSRLRARGDATLRARREMLETYRAALVARQAELAGLVATLDAKIIHYHEMEGTVEDDGSPHSHDRGGCAAPLDRPGGRPNAHAG
ncbi:MerR family transcriptional regulator [Sandaracinobacter sp. RS1-74]|uniref:MerR family transcriptional regulator n=1 Tax=Sandaracinobacteroides sayramensis TaxID=2913411 RepID=UPI001EDB0D2E|nr:MerR family transcriptional regulator [Sandaracinobacteroides sayramensis]MCG2839460.1 MerR family transcriptional regulator [Sandaracinobacteroides sayramensis]